MQVLIDNLDLFVLGFRNTVVMFVISAVLLASYTGLLIQIQKRTAEREAKVRVLTPQRRLEPVYDLRRSASN